MAVVTPVRIRDWTPFSFFKNDGVFHSLSGKCFTHSAPDDSLAERSKAPDSSSGGAIRVGSNPTAVKFLDWLSEMFTFKVG